jgi:hypothetical protein
MPVQKTLTSASLSKLEGVESGRLTFGLYYAFFHQSRCYGSSRGRYASCSFCFFGGHRFVGVCVAEERFSLVVAPPSVPFGPSAPPYLGRACFPRLLSAFRSSLKLCPVGWGRSNEPITSSSLRTASDCVRFASARTSAATPYVPSLLRPRFPSRTSIRESVSCALCLRRLPYPPQHHPCKPVEVCRRMSTMTARHYEIYSPFIQAFRVVCRPARSFPSFSSSLFFYEKPDSYTGFLTYI